MTVINEVSYPKTHSEKAYRNIRDDIVNGELRPETKLKMTMLKSKYNIGSAPIREALSRLTSDKLVLQEGQKGFEVAPLSREDAIDVARIRTLLEVEALKESINSGNDEWEASVVATYHRLRLVEERGNKSSDYLKEIEIWNGKFHQALVGAANSKWLMEFRNQIYVHHERYRVLSRSFSKNSRNTASEHKQIFKAAIDRKTDLLCELIINHIKKTTDNVLVVLSK